MKIINPATTAVIADVPEDTAATVAQKVAAARIAQPGWWATPFETRRRAVATWNALVAENKDPPGPHAHGRDGQAAAAGTQ